MQHLAHADCEFRIAYLAGDSRNEIPEDPALGGRLKLASEGNTRSIPGGAFENSPALQRRENSGKTVQSRRDD